jgi:hypothetical protein
LRPHPADTGYRQGPSKAGRNCLVPQEPGKYDRGGLHLTGLKHATPFEGQQYFVGCIEGGTMTPPAKPAVMITVAKVRAAA